MDTRSEDSIVREIVREVTLGVGDTGVRPGLIGEIGNTWPWTENEKKVVRAAVEAQRQTGAPLMIHPGRRSEEHTSELQSQSNLVCRLLLEKKKRQLPPSPRAP